MSGHGRKTDFAVIRVPKKDVEKAKAEKAEKPAKAKDRK